MNDSVIEEKRNRPEKNLLIVLLVIAKLNDLATKQLPLEYCIPIGQLATESDSLNLSLTVAVRNGDAKKTSSYEPKKEIVHLIACHLSIVPVFGLRASTRLLTISHSGTEKDLLGCGVQE